MAKTGLRLDTRRALRDGTFPVLIRVGHCTNLYLPTQVYLRREEWDERASLCIGKSAKVTNRLLAALVAQVAGRLIELRESGLYNKLTRAQLRQMLLNLELEAPTVGMPTLGDLFDKVMAEKQGSTLNTYRHALRRINIYCGDAHAVAMQDFTAKWLEGFYKSLSGLANNTIFHIMMKLRHVAGLAAEEGQSVDLRIFRRFKLRIEETPMRILPVEKMRQLIALDLPPAIAERRDIFVLIFYLIGINTQDLFNLTADNIRDGRIVYRRAKTGRLYSIKIEPEAAEIIERYRGKRHLIRYFDRYEKCSGFVSGFNRSLSMLGPEGTRGEPFEKKLTSYWARYSWANYAVDIDVPRDTISAALGHSTGVRVTSVYLKLNLDKVDEANRRVIDYVLRKGEWAVRKE